MGAVVFAMRVGWLASGLGEHQELLITRWLYWNQALNGAALQSYRISGPLVFLYVQVTSARVGGFAVNGPGKRPLLTYLRSKHADQI